MRADAASISVSNEIGVANYIPVGDRTLRLWDLASGALLRTLEGHTDVVEAVAVTADGSSVVSGSWDKTLTV